MLHFSIFSVRQEVAVIIRQPLDLICFQFMYSAGTSILMSDMGKLAHG